jgi:FixJ family two-component response regulator
MQNQAPPTIFVIDENDRSRHLLCEDLRSFGWYAAGFTPKQICRNAPPAAGDCIVLDAATSATTAIQVLAALHLRDVMTPVVAITAQIDAELIVRTRTRNVRAVVRRPFETEDLCTTILQVIGGRRVVADA